MSLRKCCEVEIAEKKEKTNNLHTKIISLKDNYRVLLIKNLQQDLIIRDLKRQLESKIYTSFEQIFSVETVAKLRSVENSKKGDSQFVSIVLMDLFHENINDLKMMTLSGRSKLGDKQAIPFEKKQILERLYEERMNFLIPSEHTERKHNLAKLIQNALDNLHKTK